MIFLSLISQLAFRAQSTTDYLVFVLNGTIYAHATAKPDLRTLGTAYHDLTAPDSTYDIYNTNDSPIPPEENYGFHHGIWSPDRQQFVYLQIQFPHYQLKLFAGGESQLLLESEVTHQRGWLVPLGWKADGKILLIERHMLYNLKNAVRIWQLDPSAGNLVPYANTAVSHLHGQNIVLPDATSAFIGFDAENQKGYLFHFESGEFSTFEATITLPTSPSSVFEVHPIRVIGIFTSSQLIEFINTLNPATADTDHYPEPFLHWPLPPHERRITCYPDSPHTVSNFEVTCPPLGRMYEGHEGTDIGGLSDGLPLGTAVHAAAPGIVIDTYTECDDSNPSCGGAYGNFITIEHTLTVNGITQTWFTGYGHLQTVETTPFTVLTDITRTIGTSGSTGQGGPHLHFEVRFPHQRGENRWIDPWSAPVLWVGGDVVPLSAENHEGS